MAYIGVSPSNGVRRVHTYTATASQTTFSGAGAEGTSLSYKDSNFVDVYQNGVKLGDADYTATSGTSIVLAQGASVDDLVVVVVFDVFSVADTVSKADGGTFDGNVTMGGTFAVTGTTALTGNLTATGRVLVDDTTEATSTTDGSLQTDGGLSVAKDIVTGDDIHLKSDSAQISFGADSEVRLDHTADTGLTLQGSGLNTNFSLLAFHTTDGTTPDLRLGKSSNNTVGTFAETADGEALGQIRFTGQDSNNSAREGMTIAVTQDGSSTSSTVPAKITFTNSGGERLRIMANGRLENQSPSNTGNVLQDFRIDFRNENNAGIMAGIGCVRTDNANAPGAFVIRTSTDVDSSSNNGDGEISEKFRVAANGDLTATDTSISSNSDSRLKENISDFAYDLDKFKALKTKTFDWKNPKLHGEKSGQRGFIAQDIETVDDYWIEEIEVPADSDDFQYLEDKDIFYTKNSTIPDGKKVGDLEYKARFAKTSKLGQKDAMYVSVIQQLLTKIETLEADVKALKGE